MGLITDVVGLPMWSRISFSLPGPPLPALLLLCTTGTSPEAFGATGEGRGGARVTSAVAGMATIRSP